jgi:hypothetical protein
MVEDIVEAEEVVVEDMGIEIDLDVFVIHQLR